MAATLAFTMIYIANYAVGTGQSTNLAPKTAFCALFECLASAQLPARLTKPATSKAAGMAARWHARPLPGRLDGLKTQGMARAGLPVRQTICYIIHSKLCGGYWTFDQFGT
jgi:hypothetical protein